MVLSVITNAMVFVTFSLFGQLTNILSNALSDETAWWLLVVSLVGVALIV